MKPIAAVLLILFSLGIMAGMVGFGWAVIIEACRLIPS